MQLAAAHADAAPMKAMRFICVGSDLSGVSVSAWYHWSGHVKSSMPGTATDGLLKQMWSLPPVARCMKNRNASSDPFFSIIGCGKYWPPGRPRGASGR